jgi:hypothetical protein
MQNFFLLCFRKFSEFSSIFKSRAAYIGKGLTWSVILVGMFGFVAGANLTANSLSLVGNNAVYDSQYGALNGLMQVLEISWSFH